ncbi:MATE efflux family protein subfamily [Gaeumannomyces tritici R3-111a-1]|uniref:MATE efflux family protein subfamily n=1 Tax=Gaeumannomyces tritici (strain R3-111a-1) TaxID=644352 RepID=J3PKJ4_GAET3|nr:MATE efflux family protein subfamily [Gaeumannomyces tritici R3-111a-1]EJT68373.1 MATE efflux family protein subfamily [Gaeumannomyces tritici R3-111a-1]
MSSSERDTAHQGTGEERRGSILSALLPRAAGGRRDSILADLLPESLPLPSSFVATAPIVQEILTRDIAECSDDDDEDDYDERDFFPGYEDRMPGSHRNSSQADRTEPTTQSTSTITQDVDADVRSPSSDLPPPARRPRRDSGRRGSAADSARLAFHPNGVAFGLSGFSSVSIQGVDRPVANPQEVSESLGAEVRLLRDNGLIPPRHPDAERRRRSSATLAGRVYRRFFSTRVRDHEGDQVPIFSTDMFASSSHSVLPGVQEQQQGQEQPDERAPLLGSHRAKAGGHGATGDAASIASSDSSMDETIPTPPADEIHDRWEEAIAAHCIQTTWQRETKTLVQYAAPLIVTFLLHYSVTVASVLTVGRLGMVELAAVNLATMTASITCYVPVQGLATCLDTLCAQAYGSGHKHLVGLQAQRMTWFLWILMVPIAVLWWFSGPILEALVPSKETAALAALYLRFLILGMPGVAAFESGKRFVQAQGLFRATTYVLLVGAPLSFLQNWLFVFKLGWHFAGAATAMAITQNLLPLLLVLYVRFVDGRQCWKGFTWKAFSNWGPMIKLALPGMIMIEAQFSVLEILTLAAGHLGTAQLAAQSVLVTVTSTSFNVPFPLAIATSTRVANLIGANLGDAARKTAKVAIVAACAVGLVNMTLLITLRRTLPAVFTADEEVISIASHVMLVCAVMQIFDALAAVSHGILRGVGRQAIGGYANLFSYYFIALPVSLSTAFALGWKLSGLWAGLVAGLAVVSALELLYLYSSDWDSAIVQAAERMRSEEVDIGEPKATNV